MITIEKSEPTVRYRLVSKLAAVILALGFSALVFMVYGVDPLYAYTLIAVRSSTFSGLTEIVTKMIPLQLCGVGLMVAFRSGVWNIGAEGQLLLGATAATWVALFLDVPEPVRLPLATILGVAGGAFWALIPGVLRVKLEVNEIVPTLMMNYIAANIVNYLVYGPWKGIHEWGFPYTDKFPVSVWLPTIPGTRIHWPTLTLGVASSILVYILFSRTTLGFEIKVSGESRRVAEYAGIDYGRALLVSMVVSGALAGLAGVGEVCGIHHRLRYASAISSGYGYAGIIVAWLGELNPLASIFSAFFIAFLFAGGDVIQISLGLPFGVVDVFNGSILTSLLISEVLSRYRVRIRWRK